MQRPARARHWQPRLGFALCMPTKIVGAAFAQFYQTREQCPFFSSGPPLQELRQLYADQLLRKGHAERVAAQYMSAGLWGSAAATLASHSTPAAQRAALQLCERVLAAAEGRCEADVEAGKAMLHLVLAPGDLQRLRQLRERLAAVVPAGCGGQAQRKRYAREQLLGLAAAGAEAAGAGTPGLPPELLAQRAATASRASGQGVRYSREQLVALAGGAARAALPDLPPELSGSSSVAAAAAAHAGAAGSRDKHGVHYSREQLLALSACAAGDAATLPALPPELSAGTAAAGVPAAAGSAAGQMAEPAVEHQGGQRYTREQLLALAADAAGGVPLLPADLARA